MSNYVQTVCTKPASGNGFIDILKADCGITLDGVHVLKKVNNFIILPALVAVYGHDGAVVSTGTKVKQIGDLAFLAYNLTFTYSADGSGDVNKIIFENISPNGSLTSKHVNTVVALNGGVFEFLGKAEVLNNQLIITSPAAIPFVEDAVYNLRGEIEYNVDVPNVCLTNDCLIKKNVYYTTKGIQFNTTLLNRFSLWTPVVFTIEIGTGTTISAQQSFYRQFGDMVQLSFRIVYTYDEAPADSNIILETLPIKPITNVIYTNGALDHLNDTTYVAIENETQLIVYRPGGVTNTEITISGEIFYQAGLV
jgi:hypothetical protein